MKTLSVLCTLIFCLTVGDVFAIAMTEPPNKAELDAAIAECESSVKKDTNGHPDPRAMDECMSGKGFSRPEGKPGQGNPPPRQHS